MIPPLLQATGLAGVFGSAEFILPLADLGAGAVDTSLGRGVGSATFTRATTAWTKLSTGLWASVASGTARSSYIGMTTAVGAYGGYFAEGAGTQLVTPTASIRDMTNAAWTAGATMTVAKDGIGIDGVTNSCSRLTGGAVSATNTAFQTLTAAASSRTYSVWLKRVTGTGIINITQDGGSTYTDVTASINSSTFTQVSLTASVLNAAFGIQVVTDTDVILADFNQFEAGGAATSPMDAAGAVRNADVLTYPSAGNMLGSIGTVFAVGFPVIQLSATSRYWWSMDDATGNERIVLSYRAASFDDLTMVITDGGVSQVGVNAGSISTAGNKVAFAYATNDVEIAEDGASIATDTSCTMPTITTIRIGTQLSANEEMNGFIRDLHGWQRRLPTAVLTAITA